MVNRARPVSVPGVETFHRREAIEVHSSPVIGPLSHQERWDTFALHYTAADDLIDGDPGESYDRLDEYLGSIQRYYTNSRGYSIGYQFAVDWLGGVWELRGWDINCAANRGWNDRTCAVLCLVDGNDALTAEAVTSINALWHEAQLRSGRAMTLRPHSDIGSTSCPGNGIRMQINAGVFQPDLPTPKPLPPPEPPKDDDDMLNRDTLTIRKHKSGAMWLTTATSVQPIEEDQRLHYVNRKNFDPPVPETTCSDKLHAAYTALYS